MVYLISLILLLLPTYLIRFSVFGVPTTFLEILIYLVFIFGLYKAVKSGFRKIPLKIILPIALLIIALLISTFISPDKRTALGELKGFFVDPILVFWLVFQFVKDGDIPKLFWSLIISGSFVAVHAVTQRILNHTTPDGRVVGIFGYSPNYIALFLAPITVLLVSYCFQFVNTRKWRLFFLSLVIILLNIVAIYFSGSRGGILALGAGIGIFAIIHFWDWIHARLSSQIIIAIVVIMAIYTSWVLFRPDLSTPITSGRVATSNNLRWLIWHTSIELGSLHPILGVGLGNYQNAFSGLTKNRVNYPEYITPQALTPHNIFLMFWLETGISGLIAFLWLIYLFFEEGRKKIRNPQMAAVFAVFFSIVVYGLIESSIWKNDLAVLYWVMWGLIWTI